MVLSLVDGCDLLAMAVLDGGDYVLVVGDHVLELVVFLELVLEAFVLGAQLGDHDDEPLDGGDELLEGGGQ